MAFSDGSWSQRDVRNEERFLIHQKIRRTSPIREGYLYLGNISSGIEIDEIREFFSPEGT